MLRDEAPALEAAAAEINQARSLDSSSAAAVAETSGQAADQLLARR